MTKLNYNSISFIKENIKPNNWYGEKIVVIALAKSHFHSIYISPVTISWDVIEQCRYTNSMITHPSSGYHLLNDITISYEWERITSINRDTNTCITDNIIYQNALYNALTYIQLDTYVDKYNIKCTSQGSRSYLQLQLAPILNDASTHYNEVIYHSDMHD